MRRLRPDGALATVGAGGGAAASGRGTETSDGAPAAGGAGTAVDGEGVSASIDGASSSPLFGAPDHRHRELIPPFGYRRDVLKANVVAVFERLAQFRNTLRDDVAGHNVPGPDVFDKLVPAKHFPPDGGQKKTRRSIKRGSRVSWRPFLLIWFTEGVTSHSPTRTTGCSIQESPRQKGKGAMITHLSYLFLPGVTPSGIRPELALY